MRWPFLLRRMPSAGSCSFSLADGLTGALTAAPFLAAMAHEVVGTADTLADWFELSDTLRLCDSETGGGLVPVAVRDLEHDVVAGEDEDGGGDTDTLWSVGT